VQTADGSWLHYASASDVGPKLGPFVQLAQDNVAGNTADQILALATGLQKTVQPDGTTVYSQRSRTATPIQGSRRQTA